MKKIILTGGGTGGHVIPALALTKLLKKEGYDIHYIGSKDGIEKELVTNIPYYEISTGKLRRYISKKNISDMIKVVKGIGDSIFIIKKIKPNVVFSKGGFVSVPVVIAAWILKVPVVIHESDSSFGLTNKISKQFAKRICVSFEELMHKKSVLTGTPIREEILKGNAQRGKEITKLKRDLPTILIIGGSSGSMIINKVVFESLDELLPYFNIIHICGKKNKIDINKIGYVSYDFVKDNLSHIFAISDVIISRAGANAIFEILALKKPNILIPLSKNASRGDQIDNANIFKSRGYSEVLEESGLSKDTFINKIKEVHKNKDFYINNMQKYTQKDSVKLIVEEIKKVTK
ncbi:MAG: undecaprenyldiphospho-muramoylpentapeptide beta-N-acetylglucosaminyltransferase [Defluviitaleaceae bacterium]|nr:undecaprenyldiphospho-muramoylpentapeptide beta-N-acetylglucosaminyltransferase [Defluviitaleaceae bacterium]